MEEKSSYTTNSTKTGRSAKKCVTRSLNDIIETLFRETSYKDKVSTSGLKDAAQNKCGSIKSKDRASKPDADNQHVVIGTLKIVGDGTASQENDTVPAVVEKYGQKSPTPIIIEPKESDDDIFITVADDTKKHPLECKREPDLTSGGSEKHENNFDPIDFVPKLSEDWIKSFIVNLPHEPVDDDHSYAKS